MATYVLIPGAGSGPWYWHRVAPQLEALGHEVVAVELPVEDDAAGLEEYVEVIGAAIGERRSGVVLVAQSMGGLTAPVVAARRPVDLLVLVAAMVPAPGESGGEWWANTGHEAAFRAAAEAEGRGPDEEGPEALFTHDLPPALVAEAFEHVSEQSGTPFDAPCPLEAWPDVPTRFLLCQDDRFFPAAFQRRVVRDRLGFEPDEMPGGHLPALGHPDELVAWLERYRSEAGVA